MRISIIDTSRLSYLGIAPRVTCGYRKSCGFDRRPGDSLSAPGLAPLLRSVAPAASCASRGFWEGTGRGLGRAAAATVAHAGTLTIAQTHDEKAEIE
eukprot:COSAG06_NODE_10361_length_1693_cov_1.440476_1_plen_97_part_00